LYNIHYFIRDNFETEVDFHDSTASVIFISDGPSHGKTKTKTKTVKILPRDASRLDKALPITDFHYRYWFVVLLFKALIYTLLHCSINEDSL